MNNNVSNLLNQIDDKRDEVVTDSYTATWRELINLYRDNEITISPDYQRLFRWDNSRQSQFIESLLLNIPTPTLFFILIKRGSKKLLMDYSASVLLSGFFLRKFLVRN